MTIPGQCHAGYYCNGGASTPTQHKCTAGSYCEEGSSIPTPCPAGMMKSSGANTPLLLTIRFHAPFLFLYSYLLLSPSSSSSVVSPSFYNFFSTCKLYYPQLRLNHSIIPISSCIQTSLTVSLLLHLTKLTVYTLGKMNKNEGSDSEDDCVPCTGGYYCDMPGTATPDESKKCDPGYFCPAGECGHVTCS